MTTASPNGTLAPRPSTTVSESDFFAVVDAVLAGTGRPACGQRQRDIIEVRDSDEVLQILAVLGGTTVAALDRHGRRLKQLQLPVAGGNIAVTHRRLWIIDNCGCRRATLLELSLATRKVIRRRPTGETPVAISATSTTVWVANFAGGTLSRFPTS